MSDLAAWLLEQIADDERAVAAILRQHPRWSVDQEQWVEGVGVVDDRDGSVAVALGDYAARHIARWDPARVLAECEARRKVAHAWLLAESYTGDGGNNDGMFYGLDKALRLLAVPYADRPGFREEWTP